MSEFRNAFLAICFLHTCGIANSLLIYKTVRVECEPNSKYIVNHTCILRAVNWQKAVLDMEGDIVGTLRNISVNFQLLRKNDANRYQPFLVNATKNMCRITDRKDFPTYTTLIVRILKTFSNLNHACPYTGHLIAKGLFVDERFLAPIPLPLGFYKFVVRFYEGYPYDDVGGVTLTINAVVSRVERITADNNPNTSTDVN